MPHLGISLKEINGAIQDIHLDDDGNLAMVHDAEAVGQHVKQRTKAFKGEWFLNVNVGVPWLTDILGSGYNPALAESVIKSVVQKTDGVTGITSFKASFNPALRELSATNITIVTTYDQEIQL